MCTIRGPSYHSDFASIQVAVSKTILIVITLDGTINKTIKYCEVRHGPIGSAVRSPDDGHDDDGSDGVSCKETATETQQQYYKYLYNYCL